MVNKRYWPFDVSGIELFPIAEKQSIEFLETAYRQGFQSYECEGMLVGAAAKSGRDGEIIRRGGRGRYWELILCDHGEEVISAFIEGFENAANAVRQWLHGDSSADIYRTIKHAVIDKPYGSIVGN